jgi:hypothetical protein
LSHYFFLTRRRGANEAATADEHLSVWRQTQHK